MIMIVTVMFLTSSDFCWHSQMVEKPLLCHNILSCFHVKLSKSTVFFLKIIIFFFFINRMTLFTLPSYGSSNFEAWIHPTQGLSSLDWTDPVSLIFPGSLSQLDCVSVLHIIWPTQSPFCSLLHGLFFSPYSSETICSSEGRRIFVTITHIWRGRIGHYHASARCGLNVSASFYLFILKTTLQGSLIQFSLSF